MCAVVAISRTRSAVAAAGPRSALALVAGQSHLMGSDLPEYQRYLAWLLVGCLVVAATLCSMRADTRRKPEVLQSRKLDAD